MNKCIVNSSGTPPVRQRLIRPASSGAVIAGECITTASARMNLWADAIPPICIGAVGDVIADHNPFATRAAGSCATSATTARSNGTAAGAPSAKPSSVSPSHCAANPKASMKSVFSGFCWARSTIVMPEAFALPSLVAPNLKLLNVSTMSMPSVSTMSMPRAHPLPQERENRSPLL